MIGKNPSNRRRIFHSARLFTNLTGSNPDMGMMLGSQYFIQLRAARTMWACGAVGYSDGEDEDGSVVWNYINCLYLAVY